MMDLLSQLNEFHFIRPHWLWAILPLLALVAVLRVINKQQSGWQSVLASHLYQHLITTQGTKKSRPPLTLLALCWLLASLALAGPTWERLPQPVYQLNTGKVVLLDMSLSMRATDVKPDRLTRAKYKAIDLVNAITEGETGLVAYAGDAFTISPLSSDAQNLTTLIPSLTPEIMPIAGSDPALGIQAAIDLLSNAGYQQGEIFWITDGVTNQQMKELSNIINSSSFRVSVLAIGTEEGAPIQMTNGELLKDSRGAIVVPKLTTNNLSVLSKTGGGRFVQLQTDDSDINYLIEQVLLDQEPTEKDDEQQQSFGDKWQEMGPYLLLLILPFAAYSFRRGLISAFLVLSILPVYSPQAQANWWDNLWQTADQQAMQAYQQQAYEQAAEQFNDPLWQATAQYKNQDYQAALEAYGQIPPNDPNYLQATYNAGNALAQLGELDKAIAAYEQVLAEDPAHQDAKDNKALLEKLKQQQEQQQQNQQNSDDQQQNQDQQDQQQGEQQEQQNSQEQQSDSSQQQPQNGNSEPGESADQQAQQQAAEDAEQQSEEQKQQAEQAAQEQAEQAKREAEPQAMQQQEQPLTDEQKEQMQRMQNLLKRVPDDPAFLLKRKMQIEAQRRKRERLPTNIQGNW